LFLYNVLTLFIAQNGNELLVAVLAMKLVETVWGVGARRSLAYLPISAAEF
jgi:hypothetical protein